MSLIMIDDDDDDAKRLWKSDDVLIMLWLLSLMTPPPEQFQLESKAEYWIIILHWNTPVVIQGGVGGGGLSAIL